MKDRFSASGLMKLIDKMRDWKITAKVTFFILGIASTIWFLIRVIPKPSRATYPCMRAAAPIMSGFAVYLLAITGSVFAFRKFGNRLLSTRYPAALGFLVAVIIFVFVAGTVNNQKLKASKLIPKSAFTANNPIGTATGYWAGRVVWVYDPDATDETCTNSGGDYWFQDDNTDQDVVRDMLADGIKKYTDTANLATAWDCLFRYFNIKHQKGSIGYTTGEKIIIKVNMTNMGASGRSLTDLMNATPQLVLALLEELIDSVGVQQADITIGDPYRGFGDFYWDKCHTKYPNVHYIEGSNTDGREITQITTGNEFFTSDVDHPFASRLPQAYMDAAYMINMPCMKSHNSAGITLTAKNHQGSVIAPGQNATNQYMGNDLHYDYPDNVDNQVMGIYRHIVDYMAHSKLGGNTLVYIIDAIWSGRNWNGFVDQWGMPPFNGDWTSSLFISQDPVATESVGYDFLYNEYANSTYRNTYHDGDDFPTWEGVEDYINQAADPANWPTGIQYDPDHSDHHSPVGSLGVYEHWNNITSKQYSVNLTGNKGGIELASIPSNLVSSVTLNYKHEPLDSPTGLTNLMADNITMIVYPNPVSGVLNIEYNLPVKSNVNIDLIASNGITVASLINCIEEQGTHKFSTSLSNQKLPKGQYICRIIVNTNGKVNISSVKLQKL